MSLSELDYITVRGITEVVFLSLQHLVSVRPASLCLLPLKPGLVILIKGHLFRKGLGDLLFNMENLIEGVIEQKACPVKNEPDTNKGNEDHRPGQEQGQGDPVQKL